MKLTVLGNYGPYPKSGGACSGYLIEDEDTKILLDCGNGVVSRLFEKCNVESLDAIILSHLHSDHMSDMLILKYAVGIKKAKGLYDGVIPVYTATDDKYILDKLNYKGAFEIIPIKDKDIVNINHLNIQFKKMNHPVETYAIKIQNENKIFVYSGDTGYTDDLIEFAKNADLFLCEAGVLEKDKSEGTLHLTPKEAGMIAESARVKRLVLTHFWPEYNIDSVIEEVDETYNSILEASHEMMSYFI